MRKEGSLLHSTRTLLIMDGMLNLIYMASVARAAIVNLTWPSV